MKKQQTHLFRKLVAHRNPEETSPVSMGMCGCRSDQNPLIPMVNSIDSLKSSRQPCPECIKMHKKELSERPKTDKSKRPMAHSFNHGRREERD